MLSTSPAGSAMGIQLAAVLISCELLLDLIGDNPSDGGLGVMINETQFSGLHLDGCKWVDVTSASQVTNLTSTIKSSRSAILERHSATDSLTHRSNTIIALRYAPTDGTSYGNILYLVELAAPPIAKVSGVSGLSLDDYCSINTSLKTLTKCFTAMGSKKKAATPPLRDSRLTHLLANALGDDTALVHALIYIPSRRHLHMEASAALTWASKATSARLKKGVYAGGGSKALVSQLQGVVASIDEPSDDLAIEMREQMAPGSDAPRCAQRGRRGQEVDDQGSGGRDRRSEEQSSGAAQQEPQSRREAQW